ncbi:MAG: hypothetical protein A3I91_03680 [Candidatus Kerfeldbacteria bacterium RIFCSPLOWO2_02_FULL_42_19]|nr:MAG: hypothetical protein A3E60_01585 [Candidatus Kerfeldbacteria bacterium RIFCSPHIGHO2_12_FULL_42_13]OGY83248.1 MAG: hypothetical protein A3I91_03680 [Candidatus Kerfeldbacteria bacterium RIFCSPLOWO2_02_FULL_42_19]OGY85695.1 MAG: hypothetical protein A3G01_00010 [Candidatus Kerfeldbacteria bacterium RIFCSPLOWO2_12_FULL_43_9]
MSLLKPQRIEDFIITLLAQGSLKNTELLAEIQHLRPHTTKQAVYAALRQMKAREEIVIYRGTAALNLTWLNQLGSFVDQVKQAYTGSGTVKDTLTSLAPGDRITYRFQDPIKTDIFWTHVLYLLIDQDQTSEPVYLYNPHEWFLFVRNQNETEFIRNITMRGKQFLLLAGNNQPLDRYAKKYFDGNMSQYYPLDKPRFKNNNYYLNVVGHILIEVWLDKKVANAIDDFYRDTAVWGVEAEGKLLTILQQKRRVRITISHNQKKAEAYKKFCRKFFYFPKIIKK